MPPGSPPAAQAAAGGEETLLAIEECLQEHAGNEQDALACIGRIDLAGLPPDGLGAWICAGRRGPRIDQTVVAAALHARPPELALEYLNDFQLACDRYRETGFTITCLAAIERLDPTWVAGVEASMTPELLFPGSGADAAIQLAEWFIERQNARIRTWVEDGGRGLLGGTPDQIHRAALVAAVVSEGPRERMDYMESVLYSAAVPASRRVGQLLAHQLGRPSTWEAGDSTRALRGLLALLDDPRFRCDAAAQIQVEFPSSGPSGCDEALWSLVVAKAGAILQEPR